jgi:hypothetical protein
MQRFRSRAGAAIAGVALAAALVLVADQPASGATFTVANANDSGPGSLRQAMLDAAAAAGDHSVIIPAGLGPINLASGINAAGVGDIVVEGNGNAVNAPGNTVFNVNANDLVLDGLVISGNQGANSASGALTIRNSTVNATGQGANTSTGLLTLENVQLVAGGQGFNTSDGGATVRDSSIEAGGQGINTSSGAILLVRTQVIAGTQGMNSFDGTLTLVETLLRGSGANNPGINTSTGATFLVRSTVTGFGGRGYQSFDGPLTVVNSTITGNGGAGVSADDALFVYATVVDNGEAQGEANIAIDNVESFASVFAGGGTAVCANDTVISYGYNWSTDDSCNFDQDTDVSGGDPPDLGPLGDNGGPTPTRLPSDASPLLDVIPPAECEAGPAVGITDDQRGLPRPAFDGCDVGAVERQAEEPVVPPGPPPAESTTGSATGSTDAVTPRFTG